MDWRKLVVSTKDSDVIDQAEALTRILSRMRPLRPRNVALADSLGCFAAHDIAAPIALPPFDNSAMDGYAILARSCHVGARLRVTGEQPAGGDLHLRGREGDAIRIFTGAPLPDGADAVIMQEDVERQGEQIILRSEVRPGDFVRRSGGDVAAGQKIVSAGERIRPETIALLAAQGVCSIEVGGEATAAIIATGDELASGSEPLRPGQIYDANTPMIHALLQELGVRVRSVACCADRQESITNAVQAGRDCDVIIISGGVSVGARDFVKPALAAAGAQLELWRVAVKPGKPFLFGHASQCAMFGLPGNPVSAFVTLLLFVRPAVLRLMGASDDAIRLPSWSASLATGVFNDGERPHYMRGALRGGEFLPLARQESHAVFGLSQSNALLLVQPGQRIAKGETVRIFTWK
ncbi:MAG: molybdopterin molybdotransferase MoeA [Chthoniobacterales bacterium]|nr:molybdopterin molybdotransferase MoeA [Chthoniobacterales bacterium]